ncbi:polyprotein [Anopheles sinensis]|uniref:Polyprotein n=1 Tax=Anopheles sinensis TaxID=74873 RepID=A0A084WPZ2_ANOSI|nr:polyprotein [Anopheles sinensis]
MSNNCFPPLPPPPHPNIPYWTVCLIDSAPDRPIMQRLVSEYCWSIQIRGFLASPGFECCKDHLAAWGGGKGIRTPKKKQQQQLKQLKQHAPRTRACHERRNAERRSRGFGRTGVGSSRCTHCLVCRQCPDSQSARFSARVKTGKTLAAAACSDISVPFHRPPSEEATRVLSRKSSLPESRSLVVYSCVRACVCVRILRKEISPRSACFL